MRRHGAGRPTVANALMMMADFAVWFPTWPGACSRFLSPRRMLALSISQAAYSAHLVLSRETLSCNPGGKTGDDLEAGTQP